MKKKSQANNLKFDLENFLVTLIYVINFVLK